MADQRVGNRIGVAAANPGGGTNRSNINGVGNNLPSGEHEDTDYVTITTLKSRLSTIDSGFYTTAMLNRMTYNDMLYAVRLNDTPRSIVDYG